jgi:O-antigen/teichoic acid export membrane protein
VAAAVGLVLIRHYLKPRFSRTTLRRMLAYGLPTVPASFAFGFLAALDRYVMQRTRTLDELAVYAVALKFFSIVTIAASAFQLAYGPFAYARARTPEAPRLYARVFSGYVALASLGALVIAMFVPEALRVLAPPAYAGAATPALWLAFAAVVFGAYTVVAIGIGLALRTPLLAWCAGGALAAGAAAHAVLTPRFGGPGAGVATFVGYATAAFLTYRVAQHVHPLPFRGGRAVALIGVAMALALAVQRWAPDGVPGVAVKLAVAGGFAALCVALKVHRDRGAIAPNWSAAATTGASEG